MSILNRSVTVATVTERFAFWVGWAGGQSSGLMNDQSAALAVAGAVLAVAVGLVDRLVVDGGALVRAWRKWASTSSTITAIDAVDAPRVRGEARPNAGASGWSHTTPSPAWSSPWTTVPSASRVS